MLGGKHKARGDAYAEIMLTSCIDLFMSIIAFLLMCAGFNHFRLINAAVPTISDNVSLQSGQSQKELNISMQMGTDGFNLTGSGDNFTNEELASVRTSIPKLKGKYDLEKLNKVLASIKWKYPKGKTLIILPSSDVVYEDVVTAMDSARWVGTKEETSAKNKQVLYPNVVLSSLVQEDSI